VPLVGSESHRNAYRGLLKAGTEEAWGHGRIVTGIVCVSMLRPGRHRAEQRPAASNVAIRLFIRTSRE